MAITYKRIKLKMLTPDFLDTFDRHQEISKVFRAKDGKWLICDVSYTEEWDKMKKEQIIDYLRSVIKEKGILYGAYFDGNLVGFTGVEGKRFGSSRQYVKLAMIHVSYAFRGRGIGKELFSLATVSAESLGAKKLYISGNSAVETQTFYRAMGCVETTEYDPDSLKAEPYDCHLEYDLRFVSRVTPVFMALGMIVGISIGFTYGNRAPIFMGLGMAVGIAFGLFIDNSNLKATDDTEKTVIKEGGETHHPDNL